MAKNVEILSRETIRPSSPTPHHLRHHKLSFLDQLAPRHYIPIVLFYHKESGLSPSEISVLLKKSLADVLTLYYPLAGTTDGDSQVSCNDEGVKFYEARVQCELREVIDKPNAEMLSHFLPFDRSGNCIEEGGRKILLAAQFNMFDCGGVAIGVCLSHIIGDGTSVTAFLNAWATTSRGCSQDIVRPTFDSAFYFPDSESELVKDLKRKIKGFITEKIETRRLVFTKLKIAALKTMASSGENSQVRNPTRVEAVSVFIWERAMAVFRAKSHPKKVFGIFHAVNLRERMIPPLPSHSFGNIYSSAYALLPIEHEEDYPVLVSYLRNAIKGIDAEYVEKLKNVGCYFESRRGLLEIHSKGELEIFSFSSWCRFPFYEIDFGWGKPIWACSPITPMKNVVIMMNTRDDEGIEAWINMLEEDMAIFESDPEILPYVT